MNSANISSFKRVDPMIYAYTHPNVPSHIGWTKIGYTEKQSVHERIRQQNKTSDIEWELLWMDRAMYKDGSGVYFTDHDFHNYLQHHMRIKRKPKTEWFEISGDDSRIYFEEFAQRRYFSGSSGYDYTLRKEQNDAVERTQAYFRNGGREFLWNAKPRFGKTLAAYDLIRRMNFRRVLIVTNRPSIANSWADDFMKFIAWRNESCFVSDSEVMKNHPAVKTRAEFLDEPDYSAEGGDLGMIAFESLQGLKDSVYFGGWSHNTRIKWIRDLEFDLLIVDESQEGVDTIRTERAFRNIDRKHTLYLSGTPFKQLASRQFSGGQIFNWSYADEQEAKENWQGEGMNPYESLPKLCLYTYQLSNMIFDEIQRGIDLSDDGDTVDYAFDLNEFFLTNDSGKFVHEGEVRRFLTALTTQEKYPFSTPELRRELPHTMWYLNRVASAKALAKLLKADPVFREYEIVIAAGDGKNGDEANDTAVSRAFERVKEAIAAHDRTITLTVGQLTVGVTIPEWSGVLMLCNMKSPSSYMQAAFRAQNPCVFTRDGQRFRKENAYVFDFDPARTLIIFDEFANNLKKETVSGGGTGEDREQNIRRLLNFFPVLGEDDEGEMTELDARAVLSIPRKLKSREVVRHGFISNFLFQNISNVFGAPGIIKEIVGKLTPAQEDPKKNKRDAVNRIEEVPVNEEGEVEIPAEIVIGKTQDLFGDKIYAALEQDIQPVVKAAKGGSAEAVRQQVKETIDRVTESVVTNVVEPAADSYNLKKAARNRAERQVVQEIKENMERVEGDYIQEKNIIRTEFEQEKRRAVTPEQVRQAEETYRKRNAEADSNFQEAIAEEAQAVIENAPKKVVEAAEYHKTEETRRTIEEDIRAHLRGFARTIPSFLMAYGDDGLTLANFDEYTEEDVFLEVTGITVEEFRFLRDGGEYKDGETGENRKFAGHLFDETVFNDSVREFLEKRRQLADYFSESQEEDIFDYIPPQKTNQIFTPKWVAAMMVDELEKNSPGCFDDPSNTFADLYMKSGLYITEIIRRLYRNEKMKALYPNERERIRHIINHQVYGMAPTRIIYLIATNYILGFDETLKDSANHFVQADAAKAAKDGELGKLVDQCFG